MTRAKSFSKIELVNTQCMLNIYNKGNGGGDVDGGNGGGAGSGEDSNGDVRTVPTLGHQPVMLGGLYSAVEDEFLPGEHNYCFSNLNPPHTLAQV